MNSSRWPWARRCLDSFLSLLYPPLCHYCKEVLTHPTHLLCTGCLELLTLIDPQERCPYCFSASYNKQKGLCAECRSRTPVLHRVGAAFDYYGPAAGLLRQMKYSNQPFLANALGAYLTVQWERLGWPFPDAIIPVPISAMRWLDRGYNQSLLLAQTLAQHLERPVLDCLKRKSGGWSQAGLNRRQRMQLEGVFYLDNMQYGQAIQNRCLLLIDDVYTTGSTFKRCGEALLSCQPRALYGLTVCRTT